MIHDDQLWALMLLAVFASLRWGEITALRRSGFDKLTRWKYVVESLGVPDLHCRDVRHSGNTLAADMGVSLRNLMARMGHDNERAAPRYQHRSDNADRAIADGFDALVAAELKRDQARLTAGRQGGSCSWADGPLGAREAPSPETIKAQCRGSCPWPGPSSWSG